MKWIVRAFGAVLVIAVILAATLGAMLYASALKPARSIGFQMVSVPDPGHPPLSAGIWYPTDAHPHFMLLGLIVQQVAADAPITGHNLPLVVISHGNAGGPGSHADLALALAEAGFVVVAPMHTGDNYADQGEVGTPAWLVDRARHIPASVDYMLKAWPGRDRIDPGRIGLFGYSAGGFTALTAIGGEPDLTKIAPHCARTPELVCQLWKPGAAPMPPAEAFAHDPRIKAAVIAAPGLGFTFVPDGLAKVTAPVQLWAGGADVNVPYATNTGPVRAALGDRVEFHAVPGAGHFAFLAPCGPLAPPYLCRDAKGFDRKAVHKTMDAEIVRFFEARLPAPARAGA
jgi:predicted dienelactone hydrolase